MKDTFHAEPAEHLGSQPSPGSTQGQLPLLELSSKRSSATKTTKPWRKETYPTKCGNHHHIPQRRASGAQVTQTNTQRRSHPCGVLHITKLHASTKESTRKDASRKDPSAYATQSASNSIEPSTDATYTRTQQSFWLHQGQTKGRGLFYGKIVHGQVQESKTKMCLQLSSRQSRFSQL